MQDKVKSPKIIELEAAVLPAMEEFGFILVETQLEEISGGYHITLFVYHPEKGNIDTLGKINRSVYPVLEKVEFLKKGFSLEVSSPGIYRKIKSLKELSIFMDKPVRIILNEGGVIQGINKGLNADTLSIDEDGKLKTLSILSVKSISLNG